MPAKRARYQTSLSCNGVGCASSHWPALRSASAAVPGTGAAIQPCVGIGSPGAASAICQPSIKRTAPPPS